MRFKIDWASLIVGSKFTVFALFYFVFEGNFPSTSPWGAYIWRGDLTEGFLRYQFGGGGLFLEGLIQGGAYFRNFTVFCYLERLRHAILGNCLSLVNIKLENVNVRFSDKSRPQNNDMIFSNIQETFTFKNS